MRKAWQKEGKLCKWAQSPGWNGLKDLPKQRPGLAAFLLEVSAATLGSSISSCDVESSNLGGFLQYQKKKL